MLKKQIIPIVRAFQSALPRGERQQIGGSPDEDRNISIHAPTRGATIVFPAGTRDKMKELGIEKPNTFIKEVVAAELEKMEKYKK